MALFANQAVTAQYVSFPKGKAVWRNSETTGLVGYPSIASVWYYQSGADTLITAQFYKKIYKISKQTNAVNDTIYHAAYREDVAKQKVWILAKNTLAEKLLFDFDIKVGDSISNWYGFEGLPVDCYFQVIAINDNELLRSYVPRKKYSFKGYNLPKGLNGLGALFVGVGFSTGFLSSPAPLFNASYMRSVCFSDEDNDKLPKCYNEGDGPNAVENDKVLVTHLTLYPNPAEEVLNIKASLQISKVIIYHSLGNKILEEQSSASINIVALPAGLYLLEVWDIEGRRVMKKFEKR